MVVLANIAKFIPLNSPYLISSQHDTEEITQTLYPLVKFILIFLIGRLGKTS